MATAFVTAPPDAAERIARILVEERLAASVNRIDCDSIYRWEGNLHDHEEKILLVKTTDERYSDLAARIEELHPYEVPCIERFDARDTPEAFGAWVDRTVR